MLRRLSFILLGTMLMLAQMAGLQAQSNGRFCVRVFEDANNNAVQEPGEPAITTGVGAELSARNSAVILQSILVQNSPTARSGEMCFDGLELGQYVIALRSADYDIPAGDNSVFTELTETQPVVMSTYGVPARALSVINTSTDSAAEDSEEVIEKSLVALAGALIVMALMAFVGILVYFFFFRSRQPEPVAVYPADAAFRRPAAPRDTRDTGTSRAVPPQDEIDYNYRPPQE